MKTPVNTGSIELDINLVEVIDQPIQDSIAQVGYDEVGRIISGITKCKHNPGNRYMAVWLPEYTPESRWIVGFANKAISLMTVIIAGKTFKCRPASLEELICYRISINEETDLIALDEVVYTDSDRNSCYAKDYTRYDKKGPKRNIGACCPSEHWSGRDGFLVVFEEVIPDSV